jgi:hypothetical protein
MNRKQQYLAFFGILLLIMSAVLWVQEEKLLEFWQETVTPQVSN